MRLIDGGGGAGTGVPYVTVLRALFAENTNEFTSSLTDRSAFRVMDLLDSRVLDEGGGKRGAASLLRRMHENVEVLRFRVTKMRWAPGGVAYDWTAVFRNWGRAPQ